MHAALPRSFLPLAWSKLAAQSAEQLSLAAVPLVAVLMLGAGPGAILSAVFLTANAGARPVGAGLGGAVGAMWGESACLLLALAGFSSQAALILGSRVSGLHRLPLAPG